MAEPALTAVDRIYEESDAIISHLSKAGEISLSLSAEDVLRKSLLLAAASYFEHRLTSDVLSFVSSETKEHQLITSLVQSKVIKRQYHTWFSWEASNANQFYAMFGEKFKKYMICRIGEDANLNDAVKSFIRLGSERNMLAHKDYASFSMNLTTKEIYDHYKSAMIFVDSLLSFLTDCSSGKYDAESQNT